MLSLWARSKKLDPHFSIDALVGLIALECESSIDARHRAKPRSPRSPLPRETDMGE
jgi:hypothetical protein